MENYQTYFKKLTAQTFSLGNNFQVLLQDLPTRINNRLAHLKSITFEATATLTYTAAPTVIGHNNLVKTLTIQDGRSVRGQFPGGFNDLRFFERFENGALPYADAITNNATGNPVYFCRKWSVGPPCMYGSPSDYLLPCAALLNGSIDGQWASALTDFSSDTTVATASLAIVAELVVCDDLKVSPFYERRRMTVSNEQTIAGSGAYAFLALGNSSSYDAFAAADLSDITVETSDGVQMNAIAAEILARAYNADFSKGSIGGFTGEPRNATYDLNNRIVNLGTPTAIAAQALDLQPVLWNPPGGRLTKQLYCTNTNLKLTSTGTQTSGTVAYLGRFLDQNGPAVATIMDEAAKELGVQVKQADLSVDTASGFPYKGYATQRMPYKGKVT
jgi:hypothetical protein